MKNSSHLFDFIQFADDTTLTLSGPQLNTLTSNVEKKLEKVLQGLLANKLIINLKKTHSMLFTNKRVDRKIDIRVNDTALEQKSECKFLGIIVDDDINWKAHIKYQVRLVRQLHYYVSSNIHSLNKY